MIPAWDSLSADEKRLYARQKEAFAAQLTHADEQFGSGPRSNTALFAKEREMCAEASGPRPGPGELLRDDHDTE